MSHYRVLSTQHSELSTRLGETVATSVAEFEAQSVHLHQTPPLGALVRVRMDDELAIYGVVADAFTAGLDAADERQALGASGEGPYTFRVRAGREAATLLRADHGRLSTILALLRPDSTQSPRGKRE